MKKRIILAIIAALLLICLTFTGCGSPSGDSNTDDSDNGAVVSDSNDIDIDSDEQTATDGTVTVAYGERYTGCEEVSLYLHSFEELPPNYITKSDAKVLGWVSREGNLWEVTDQKSIGGDSFYPYEDQIPELVGLECWECDLNYEGGYRNAERLVFSYDGRIYYTDDHYNTFTQLYDGWEDEDGYYRGISGEDE